MYLLTSIFLPMLLLSTLTGLSHSPMNSTPSDKSSAFECGFSPFSMSGMPFSMPFFIISLMFLLFDVEILLVCFYPLIYSFSFFFSIQYWVILMLILAATLYEWFKGILVWV